MFSEKPVKAIERCGTSKAFKRVRVPRKCVYAFQHDSYVVWVLLLLLSMLILLSKRKIAFFEECFTDQRRNSAKHWALKSRKEPFVLPTESTITITQITYKLRPIAFKSTSISGHVVAVK